jgi:hypothetical protein
MEPQFPFTGTLVCSGYLHSLHTPLVTTHTCNITSLLLVYIIFIRINERRTLNWNKLVNATVRLALQQVNAAFCAAHRAGWWFVLHPREVGCKDGGWLELAQDRVVWQAFVLAVLNLRVLLPES